MNVWIAKDDQAKPYVVCYTAVFSVVTRRSSPLEEQRLCSRLSLIPYLSNNPRERPRVLLINLVKRFFQGGRLLVILLVYICGFNRWFSLDVIAAMLVHRTIEKKSFGNLTLLLCKIRAIICYCFVHQHGRLITWLKTLYRRRLDSIFTEGRRGLYTGIRKSQPGIKNPRLFFITIMFL